MNDFVESKSIGLNLGGIGSEWDHDFSFTGSGISDIE